MSFRRRAVRPVAKKRGRRTRLDRITHDIRIRTRAVDSENALIQTVVRSEISTADRLSML